MAKDLKYYLTIWMRDNATAGLDKVRRGLLRIGDAAKAVRQGPGAAMAFGGPIAGFLLGGLSTAIHMVTGLVGIVAGIASSIVTVFVNLAARIVGIFTGLVGTVGGILWKLVKTATLVAWLCEDLEADMNCLREAGLWPWPAPSKPDAEAVQPPCAEAEEGELRRLLDGFGGSDIAP